MGLLEAHARLAGKNAVVVGGASGIVGRAVSLGLAKAGIHIASIDNDEKDAVGIVPEIEAHGVRMLSIYGDATDVAALDRFYDRVENEFDRIDIVVNVAGGVQRGLLLEKTREQDAHDIRLNYGYVIDSMRRAIPLIRKGGRGGSIINFTTIEAHRGAATFAVYAGAKAATTTFSRAMALELGADQIRVNLIAPDSSPARASHNAMRPTDIERIAALGPNAMALMEEGAKMYIPLKQSPAVDDIVNGVLFLASDLSRAITGTTLHIDGGTIAAMGFLDWPHGDGFMPVPLGGSVSRLFGTGE
ncbi:MAG: SDR family oxidoreductase [Rhodospirillaceae bacterium]|nr:MAG: SDR family oxidoreductase [Rhodospirillaceae bacterium]